jgi:hypothetical protein
MVGLGGLEPPTSPLSGARSSHLSYRPGEQPRNFSTAEAGSHRLWVPGSRDPDGKDRDCAPSRHEKHSA